MQTELWRLGVAELAQAIRERQVSSREVIQAHLDRIDSVNSELNAVTIALHEQALQAADEADQAQVEGAKMGPLHGVPMTVKENIDLIGSPTTSGIIALKDDIPSVDAPHVAQLKRAGAIPLARTNLPDYGLRWQTDNALWGGNPKPLESFMHSRWFKRWRCSRLGNWNDAFRSRQRLWRLAPIPFTMLRHNGYTSYSRSCGLSIFSRFT